MSAAPWSEPVKLGQISALPPGRRLERRLIAGPAERSAIAGLLGIEALESLEAELDVAPWFDGAQLDGDWRATIVQICGISLEPFSTALSGGFMVRVVPKGSALAPREDLEVVVDPEADDPPDVLEDNSVDLAAYVIEHLALEIDPFPRKPGVEFVQPDQPPESSPFDVLRTLTGGKAGE